MATPRHDIDEMASDQASKYITFNDLCRHFDGKVMPVIQDKDLVTSPAVTTSDYGKVWIVAGTGGDWSGFSVDDLAQYYDDTWYNFVPEEGWFVYVEDEEMYYYYNSSLAWSSLQTLFSGAILTQITRSFGEFVLIGNSDPDIVDTGTGYTYAFDDAINEEMAFTINLPDNYTNGNDLTFQVHWSPTDASAGSVVWGIEYSWANIVDAFPAKTIMYKTTAVTGDDDENIVSEFAVIDGTGKTAGSVLKGRIFRDASDTSDDYAADAAFLLMDVDY